MHNISNLNWRATLLAVGIATGLNVAVPAATIRVPQDQPTITAGVAAANKGDTVAVSAGTYYETNILITKAITLASLTGSTNTIIDCQNKGRGVPDLLAQESVEISLDKPSPWSFGLIPVWMRHRPSTIYIFTS
jgi:hypothetical protein